MTFVEIVIRAAVEAVTLACIVRQMKRLNQPLRPDAIEEEIFRLIGDDWAAFEALSLLRRLRSEADRQRLLDIVRAHYGGQS